MPSTILVTGGAGFIGSAVVRTLVAETGSSVVTVDRLTYAGNLDSLEPARGERHHFAHADVCDAAAIAALLARFQPSAILHSRRRCRCLHSSTDEVFRTHDAEGELRDGSPYRPNRSSAATKAGGDALPSWEPPRG